MGDKIPVVDEVRGVVGYIYKDEANGCWRVDGYSDRALGTKREAIEYVVHLAREAAETQRLAEEQARLESE